MAILDWQVVKRLSVGRWFSAFQCRPLANSTSQAADYVIKMAESNDDLPAVVSNMFRNEIMVADTVCHPNLVTILEADVEGSVPYCVMPYYEGETLQFRLGRSRTLPIPTSLRLVRQIAQALSVLHSRRWVHRDIKPENLIISSGEHLTLIDLGMVTAESATSRGRGDFCGTIEYSSPESFCNSVQISTASDIYSIGVILFEMLSGRLPFWDKEPDRIAVGHLRETPPDVRSMAPHVPNAVARIVRKLLAKDPLRRPTAEQLVSLMVELEIETFEHREVA